MEKLLFLTFLLLGIISNGRAQNNYKVIAENGLIGRDKPSKDGTKVAKIVYGSVVELIERTGIYFTLSDSLNEKKGEWVKIVYSNFPFESNEREEPYYYDTVFVFDGFLEPMEIATIELQKISIDEFLKLRRMAKSSDPKPKVISDFETAKSKLKGRAGWKMMHEQYPVLEYIVLDNGKILKTNHLNEEYSFVSYFPKDEVLFFEGGHTSDFSVSLKTGETTYTVGAPIYYVTSPNATIRLNAWFPGQECYDYFFQLNTNDGFKNIAKFGWGNTFGDDVCTFKYFGWISESEFIYEYYQYSDEGKPLKQFRKGNVQLY